MNFSKSVHFSKLTFMLAFCLLLTTACTEEEGPISAPEELTVDQVVNVIMSNKFEVGVDGFVQSVNYHNKNTIKVSSIDNQEYYYRLDEERKLFSIITEIGEQKDIVSPRSAFGGAGGDVECRKRTRNGDGTSTNSYVECGLFSCYLYEDQVSSGGVTTPDANPTYLGFAFSWMVTSYCNRLELGVL